MVATDMVQVGMRVQNPGQVCGIVTRFSDLSRDELRRVVRATRVHQQTGAIAPEIDQLKRPSPDFTFEQVNAIEKLLHWVNHPSSGIPALEGWSTSNNTTHQKWQ
jgi:hypothetical protein